MRGLWKLTTVQFKLFLREPIGAFFTLGFPPMLVILFGAMYGNDPSPYFDGFGSMDVSMPGYTGMILGTVGFLSVPISLSGMREIGVLRRYKASALRPITFIIADVITNLLMTLLGMVILLFVGWLIYRVKFEGDPFQVACAVVLGGLSMFSIGYVIAAIAPTARTAQVVGMVLFYPMLFLSGAAMPLEILPESIRTISRYLPLTYVVNLLKGLWFGGSWRDYLLEAGILAGVLVVCTLFASRFFRWD